jgi:hypothetical protein
LILDEVYPPRARRAGKLSAPRGAVVRSELPTMAEIGIERALANSELVRTEVVMGQRMIQVWCGGTTVNVYSCETGEDGVWNEVTMWSISDGKGRPVERDEIEKHMMMRFGQWNEEGWSQ